MSLALVEERRSPWNLKWAVRLEDGAEVEAVLYRGDTLCISSQVGCAVRCPFCASGRNGLGRSLRLEELLGQVEAVEALGHRVVRTTVSGVGEPLHNASNVIAYLQAAAGRRTPSSVTTTGGTLEHLPALMRAPHNGVTVSVHAGTEAMRSELVPHGPPLEALFTTLRTVLPELSGNRRKKIALAYLLVEGRNDTDHELDAFVSHATGLRLAVHLYAMNPIDQAPVHPSSRSRYEAAYRRLREAGLVVRMSSQARIDENGGCGTLVAVRVNRGARVDVGNP